MTMFLVVGLLVGLSFYYVMSRPLTVEPPPETETETEKESDQ